MTSTWMRWSKKMRAAGRCPKCGGKRGVEVRVLCRSCRTYARNYMRRRRAEKQ